MVGIEYFGTAYKIKNGLYVYGRRVGLSSQGSYHVGWVQYWGHNPEKDLGVSISSSPFWM